MNPLGQMPAKLDKNQLAKEIADSLTPEALQILHKLSKKPNVSEKLVKNEKTILRFI